MIREARERVYADFYVLGGASGRAVAQALIRRYDEGLDVRLLLDPYLGTVWPLRSETLPVKAVLDASGIPLRFSATRHGGRFVRRRVVDHHKLLVTDGRSCCVGGTNVLDLSAPFADLVLRIDGPVCGDVERQFRHDWKLAGDATRFLDDTRWLAAPIPAPVNGAPDLRFGERGLLQSASADGLSTVRLVGTGPGRLTFVGALLNAIDSARRSIDVHVHQLNHVGVIRGLARAQRRGVSVRVVVDPIELHHYLPGVRSAPRATLNAGAVVALHREGVPVRFVRLDNGFMAYHMKLALFDRSVLLAGTANWTRRAATVLTETVVEIAGGPVIPELQAWFDTGWRKRTGPASAGLSARAVDATVRLLL